MQGKYGHPASQHPHPHVVTQPCNTHVTAAPTSPRPGLVVTQPCSTHVPTWSPSPTAPMSLQHPCPHSQAWWSPSLAAPVSPQPASVVTQPHSTQVPTARLQKPKDSPSATGAQSHNLVTPENVLSGSDLISRHILRQRAGITEPDHLCFHEVGT